MEVERRATERNTDYFKGILKPILGGGDYFETIGKERYCVRR